MLNETWDVVESPQFAVAMTNVLDKSLDVLADQILDTIFTPPRRHEEDGVLAPVSKPMASLLTQLKPSKTVLVVDGDTPVHAEATRELLTVCNLCEAIFDSEEDTD